MQMKLKTALNSFYSCLYDEASKLQMKLTSRHMKQNLEENICYMDKTSLQVKYLVRKGCFFTASIYNRQLNLSFQANNIHVVFQLKQRKQNNTYFLNIWLKLIVYLTVILFSGSTVIMPLIISWTSVGMKTGILKCPRFT